MSAINDRISELLEDSGLTKTAFAQRINVSQQYISKLTNAGTPSDRTILDICREFGVNETWLRTGEGEKYMHLSRRDAVAAYVGKILGGKVTPLEEALIEFMAETSAEEWEELSRIINRFTSKMEKPGTE